MLSSKHSTCPGCGGSVLRQGSSPSDIVNGRVVWFHVRCHAAWRVLEAMKVVDAHFPLCGPCGICGAPEHDARHRVLDTIVGRHRADDSVEMLARDYDRPVIAIEAAVTGWKP